MNSLTNKEISNKVKGDLKEYFEDLDFFWYFEIMIEQNNGLNPKLVGVSQETIHRNHLFYLRETI